MALVLHKVHKDGTISHEPFSKGAWELALQDQELASRRGHKPGDCRDALALHWAKMRRDGYPCARIHHAFADEADPTWVGDRCIEPVKIIENAAPPEAPKLATVWPPDGLPLTPKELSDMSGLGLFDCKDILTAPRRELPPGKVLPRADKRGQLLLF